ncbi:heterokaryon incompatibility protein-domain-containing protein [Triangularia verruculosa]|uniref:Heterokaryon incompatibility protein-domain-containing protein n=1 Tax=Triangularia verruculosa TaxID=2587418 RepID=A0AAN7ATT1_9PEZI|nr:heterokaryon incompatibility protein-domain-containing protein [Triangularia verruculosa]
MLPNPSCDVCRTILEVTASYLETQFEDEDRPMHESAAQKLGSYGHLVSNTGCNAHETFFKSEYIGRQKIRDSATVSVRSFFYKAASKHTPRTRFLQFYFESHQQSSTIVPLVCSSEDASHDARSAHGGYINLDKVNSWKRDCESGEYPHGPECFINYDFPKSMAWLIDTWNQCLVPATPDLSYVAVSYVWGQKAMLMTKRANLSDHQEDGVFDRLAALIPATIRNAISLVPLIGERYLWVDSLCIVQDEDEAKHAQIRDMAEIYGRALLTIVAADGDDADHGLRGIPGISKPRQLHPEFRLSSKISIRVSHNMALGRTTWARRGWTWQELNFSQRRLTFVDGSVRWRCSRSFHLEDNVPDADFNTDQDGDLPYPLDQICRSKVATGDPSLEDLEWDIMAYNQRILTYDEDVLPAFEGTLATYTQTHFPRGFLYGMPISFLDLALLWYTPTHGSFSKCRQPTRRGWKCPPRWAWSGWKGKVYQRWGASLEDCFRGPLARHGEQTVPILTWTLRTSPTADPVTIPFQNDWYEWKTKYMGKMDRLPAGWKYEERDQIFQEEPIEEVNMNRRRLLQEYHILDQQMIYRRRPAENYMYRRDAELSRAKFHHPIPCGQGLASSIEQMSQPIGRFLCARTQQARLWGDRQREPMPEKLKETKAPLHLYEAFQNLPPVLRDVRGQEVGEIRPHSKEDNHLINSWRDEKGEGENAIGYPCDIVAISRGYDLNFPVPPTQEYYTFYNVLWVEWNHGVAYRRGVGRVKRSAWENMKTEDVELVLG